MKNLTFISIFLFLLTACSDKKEESEASYLTIPIDTIKELLPIDTLAKSIRYIPLSNDITVKDIQKLLTDEDGNLYTSDSNNNGIFKFNKNGDFICQISQKGQGPGEYYRIKDFDLDNNLVVINGGGKDILYYDKDGKHIKSYRNEMNAAFLAVHKDTLYQSECRRMRIFIGDSIIPFQVEDPKYFLLYDHRNHFTKNGDLIYWEDCFNDTIYQMTKGKPEPSIYVDFKDFKLPATYAINDDLLSNPEKDKYYTNISEFRISDDFIAFYFFFEKKTKLCIYDRSRNKTYVFSKIANNMDFIPIIPTVLAIRKNKIYFAIDGMLLYSYHAMLKKYNTEETLLCAEKIEKALGKTPEEMDNPVIIEVTCK